MRIGELARRTGMAEATLRAWERRYGLPRPARTVGGHRLYSDRDVLDIQRAQRLIDDGWAVHAAVRKVARESGVADPVPSTDLTEALSVALDTFEPGKANDAFDRLLGTVSIPELVDTVIAPVVRRAIDEEVESPEAQARWAFTAAFLESRLWSLLAELDGGRRGLVVAAAAPGEPWVVANLLGSVILANAGWSVRQFGPDLRNDVLAAAVRRTDADLAFVTAHHREPVRTFLSGPLPTVPTLVGGRSFRELGTMPTGVHLHVGPLATLATLADQVAPTVQVG
jgi:MerR family transcriptional regulator, light-induced transcriptional regulator